MITAALLPDLDKLNEAGAFRSPMLMLGAQEIVLAGYERREAYRFFRERFAVAQYDSLDLADGDLCEDLNDDLKELSEYFGTVFNLGTLEHVWNIHRAYCNALRAVAMEGVFITHSPVGGWADPETGLMNHGMHQTRAQAIKDFVARNGFEVGGEWTSRFGNRGVLYWMWATKHRHIEHLGEFEPPRWVRGMGKGYRIR